jgi:ATP-dependent DNA helicase RecG
MNLREIPVEELPSTTAQTKKRLEAVGLRTLWDLITYTPFRYDDYSKTSSINQLQEGDVVTIRGNVTEARTVRTRNRLTIQKVSVFDGTGSAEINWFNQPYILNVFRPGALVSVAGAVKRFADRIVLEPKEYEILKSEDQPLKHTGRIVPVYPSKYGLSARTIREKVQLAMEGFVDEEFKQSVEFLPEDMRTKYGLWGEYESYRELHNPENEDRRRQAQYRLAFDEFFLIQLSSLLVRKEWEKETVGTPLDTESANIRQSIDGFVSALPFELTGAQKRVTKTILHEMNRSTPMNRFVQGDVGSGKTAVAAIAAYATWLNGFQTLIMAPTEILAQQHYATISRMFEPYGIGVGIQTKSYKVAKGDKTVWEYDVIIGTHALLTAKVNFARVGLVVIDEQHRFGVAQRATLKQKGMNPHLLTMTATPIPRTVALTLYGELDLSVIDEMPKGRLPIKTAIIPEEKRDDGYAWIKKQIDAQGVQVYIICPLIEESDAETMQSVRAANKEYEYLSGNVFRKYRVALIHGKMKSLEKEKIMKSFKDKEYDILVSTSVVEVGIDVPNATIMIIEGAERYGLAQLHQLRGRVGRGDTQSYCFLYTSTSEAQFSKRLRFFSRTTSGMSLAEFDLEQRGAGEIYGTRQSGLDSLRFAEFTDLPLIEKTKTAATELAKRYSEKKFPELAGRIAKLRITQIAKD